MFRVSFVSIPFMFTISLLLLFSSIFPSPFPSFPPLHSLSLPTDPRMSISSPSAFCQPYYGYTFSTILPSYYNYSIPASTTQQSVESTAQGLTTVFSALSLACRLSASSFLSLNIFPPCIPGSTTPTPNTLPQCNTQCYAILNTCTYAEQIIVSQISNLPMGYTLSDICQSLPNSTTAPSCVSLDVTSLSLANTIPVPQCVPYSPSLSTVIPFLSSAIAPNRMIYQPTFTSPLFGPSFYYGYIGQITSQFQTILDAATDYECRVALIQFVADSSLWGCDDSIGPLGLSFVQPRLPCISTCSKVFNPSVCPTGISILLSSIWELATGSALNCTGIGGFLPNTNNADYPVDMMPYSILPAGLADTIMCYPPDVVNSTITNHITDTTVIQQVDPPHASCVPYPQQSSQGLPTFCASFIPSDQYVYIPAGYYLPQMDAELSGALDFLADSSVGCNVAVGEAICLYIFQRCDNTSFIDEIITPIFYGQGMQALIPLIPIVPLPRQPHIQICQQISQQCPGYLSSYIIPQDYANTPSNGFLANYSADGNMAIFPLSDVFGGQNAGEMLSGMCTFPSPQPQLMGQPIFSASSTVLGAFPVSPSVTLTLSTQPNPGISPFSLPSSTLPSLIPPHGSCQIFDSTFISQYTPPLFPPNTRTSPPFVDIPKSYCQGIIEEGSSVYIPGGLSLIALNLEARQAALLWAFAPTDTSCSVDLAIYVCSQLFQPCNDHGVNVPYTDIMSGMLRTDNDFTFPLPQSPCQSVCQNVISSCGNFLLSLPAESQPVCNANDHGPAFPPNTVQFDQFGGRIPSSSLYQLNFPVSSATFFNITVPGFAPDMVHYYREVNIVGQTQCASHSPLPVSPSADGSTQAAASMLQFDLPPYTVNTFATDQYGRPGNPNSKYLISGSIALACPTPYYDFKWQNDVANIAKYGVPIDFAISVIFLLSWWIIPKLRKQRFVLLVVTGSFIATFSRIILFWTPSKEVNEMVCQNNSEPTQIYGHQQKGSNELCTAQSILFIVGDCAVICIWNVMMIDLFIKIIMEKKFNSVQKRIFDYFCWAIAIVFPLSALPAILITGATTQFDEVGNSQGQPFCEAPSLSLTWIYLICPSLTGLFQCLFILPLIIYKVVQASKNQRKGTHGSNSSSGGSWKFTSAQKKGIIKTISFCVVSFIEIFIATTYFFNQAPDVTAKYVDSFEEWITCYVQTLPQQIYVDGNVNFTCPDRPASDFNGPFFVMAMFLQIMGNSIFLVFIYQPPINEWRKYIESRRKGTGGYGSEMREDEEDTENSAGTDKSTKSITAKSDAGVTTKKSTGLKKPSSYYHKVAPVPSPSEMEMEGNGNNEVEIVAVKEKETEEEKEKGDDPDADQDPDRVKAMDED